MAFGAEFCDVCFPAGREVREAKKWAEAEGLTFSLVTPLLREGSLDRAAQWLDDLREFSAGWECVFNDWGLLHWALEHRTDLRFVAGRILGYRRGDDETGGRGDGAGMEPLGGSAWDDPQALASLRDLGVVRVEMDLLPDGDRRPSLPPGVSLSLCAPWIPVSLSRPSETEDLPHGPGACVCRPADFLEDPQSPEKLYSRGTATFVRVASEPSYPSLKALGADRLVWAERLPV